MRGHGCHKLNRFRAVREHSKENQNLNGVLVKFNFLKRSGEVEHKTLFLDLETSGLVPQIEVPGKRPGTTKKEQLPYETGFMEYPFIVSMAWKIDDGETIYHVLNPEGRDIPKEASDIHHITTEIANESKTTFSQAILELIHGENSAMDVDIIVGHGLYFDTSIIKANVLREISKKTLDEKVFEEVTQLLHKNKRIDTMRSSAKMMRGWATLSELHMKIFHTGFEAHHAKNDCEAVERCYQWLKQKGIVPTWEKLQEKAKDKEEKV